MGLAFVRLAPDIHQLRSALGIGAFGPVERATRCLGHHGLGPRVFFQILNFLGPCQQARLLGIGRVKTDAVCTYCVALGDKQILPCLQLSTLGKGLVHILRGIRATQPLGHDCSQASVMDLHFIGQRRQGAGGAAAPGERAAEERQLDWRQVLNKGLHHL